MSKGYLIFAQNNGTTDYIKQAELLAASIKKYCNIKDVTIISEFEDDHAKDSDWKIENRWKAYELSPYDETIVLDADMLFCKNVDHWWDKFSNYDMFLTSDVLTYRSNKVTSIYYRKTFIKNKLPNIYTAFYYFKKTPKTECVFKLLKEITINWKSYYARYLKNMYQTGQSFDLNMALAIKLLGMENEVTDTTMVPTFIHLKPQVQDWDKPSKKVSDRLPVYFFDDKLMLDSFIVNDILHYVEDEFITDELQEFFNAR